MHYSLARFPPCLYKYVQPPDSSLVELDDEKSSASMCGSFNFGDEGEYPQIQSTKRYKALRNVASNMSLTSKSVSLAPIMRHRPSSMSLLMDSSAPKLVCETENAVKTVSSVEEVNLGAVVKPKIYEKLWNRVSGAVSSTPMYFSSLINNPRSNYPKLFPNKADLIPRVPQVPQVPQAPQAKQGQTSVRAVSLKRSSSLHYTEIDTQSRSTPSEEALAAAIAKALDELSPELEHLALVNLDSLQCPLCFDVFSTIQPLPCCGNWSCEFCLQHWVSLHHNCPFCRAQLDYADIGEWSKDSCLREDAKIDANMFENLVSRCHATSPTPSATSRTSSVALLRNNDDNKTLCDDSEGEAAAKRAYYYKDTDLEKRIMQDFHLIVHQYVLDSLQVSCIYDTKGCEWRGERRLLRKHIEQSCCETRKLPANSKGYMTIDITDLCGGMNSINDGNEAVSSAVRGQTIGSESGSVSFEHDNEHHLPPVHRNSIVSLFGGSFGVGTLPGMYQIGTESERGVSALESQQLSYEAAVQRYIRRQRLVVLVSFVLCILFPILVVIVNLHYN